MAVWGEGVSVWHNLRTGEVEVGTPSNWADYIPQTMEAQGLYGLYLRAGMSEDSAAIKVLELVIKGSEDEQ